MKNAPELYRNYQAYIIGSEINASVHLQLHFEGQSCPPVIVEVSKSVFCTVQST